MSGGGTRLWKLSGALRPPRVYFSDEAGAIEVVVMQGGLMSPACLNTFGLILTLGGVIALFRFGMPYRVRTNGASFLLLEEEDVATKKVEHRYDVYGWIGLVAIVIGTAIQVAANWV